MYLIFELLTLWKLLKISLNLLVHSRQLLIFQFSSLQSRLRWNLLCYSIVREKIENAVDADGSDSPGNFTGPSLLCLSVFLSPSELSGSLKCQSQISALPAEYTKTHSAALEVWLLVMYSMLDLTHVFETETGLAVVSIVQILECDNI